MKCRKCGHDIGEVSQTDINFLVEFEPCHYPVLLELLGMGCELSEMFDQMKIDLKTAEDLGTYFRN